MTDPNPELIEKAAIATYEGMQHPNWHAPLWDEIDETGRERFLNAARAAIEAVADDLRAEGAAQALEDAADRLDLTGLERNSELSRWDYDSLDFHEELVAEWLTAQARAAKLRGPTSPQGATSDENIR